VPALEDILYEALPVLDHGFVRVIDYMATTARSSRRRASPMAAAPGGSARIAVSSSI